MKQFFSLLIAAVVLVGGSALIAGCEDEVKVHREEHRAPRTVSQEEVVVP